MSTTFLKRQKEMKRLWNRKTGKTTSCSRGVGSL